MFRLFPGSPLNSRASPTTCGAWTPDPAGRLHLLHVPGGRRSPPCAGPLPLSMLCVTTVPLSPHKAECHRDPRAA